MTNPTHSGLIKAGILLVLLHLLITVPHGLAHSSMHIEMNSWQNIYILLVINVLPLVAVFLIWKRLPASFLLLLVAMLGSLIFGVYYHFVAPGPDNVAEVGSHDWTRTFQITAVLLAVSELAGVVVGLLGIRSQR
jgi:hypothetical protein